MVRDDGTGLSKGVKLERARRRAASLPDLDDSLDIFHTLREGGRALRTTWGAAPAPWSVPTRLRRNTTGVAVRGNRGRVMARFEPAVASGRAALGSRRGRRVGLERAQVGVRVLHARRPVERPRGGRGGRVGAATAPEWHGVG